MTRMDELYSNCTSQETNILMGDFNAKVVCEKHGKTAGPYGLGMCNERGERLIDWCEEKKLVIMNTWFAAHPRRRYTWASSGERTRNQIDYNNDQ